MHVHEWRPLFDAEGGWLQNVAVQLQSEQELRRLHHQIHGMRLCMGGFEAAVGVDSQFISLDDGGLAAPSPPPGL